MRERLADYACSILTHAAVEMRLSEIPKLRDAPGPTTAPPLPKRFLRYCDEQTVVGMAAVLRAIDRLPAPRPSFDRWGVLAASCQPGRIMGAAAVIGTRKLGCQGVSPHVVPQCSLHSQASAVSVALSMHGPHFGIGGGPEAFDEALLAACSMISVSHAESEFTSQRDAAAESAGAWLILTGWEAEPSLDADGRPISDPICRGLAIALLPGEVEAAETVIAVAPGGPSGIDAAAREEIPTMAARILSLAAALSGDAAIATTKLPLRHGFEIELHRSEVGSPLALEAA